MFTVNIYDKETKDSRIRKRTLDALDMRHASDIAIANVSCKRGAISYIVDGNDVSLVQYVGRSNGYVCRFLLK